MSMPVRDASDNHIQKEQGRGNLWGNTPTPVSNQFPPSQLPWSQGRREIGVRDCSCCLAIKTKDAGKSWQQRAIKRNVTWRITEYPSNMKQNQILSRRHTYRKEKSYMDKQLPIWHLSRTHSKILPTNAEHQNQ